MWAQMVERPSGAVGEAKADRIWLRRAGDWASLRRIGRRVAAFCWGDFESSKRMAASFWARGRAFKRWC